MEIKVGTYIYILRNAGTLKHNSVSIFRKFSALKGTVEATMMWIARRCATGRDSLTTSADLISATASRPGCLFNYSPI